MHGHRQEEDGVAVVGPRAGAEVLLHGLHDGEQLLRERGHVVEQHLRTRKTARCQVNRHHPGNAGNCRQKTFVRAFCSASEAKDEELAPKVTAGRVDEVPVLISKHSWPQI